MATIVAEDTLQYFLALVANTAKKKMLELSG